MKTHFSARILEKGKRDKISPISLSRYQIFRLLRLAAKSGIESW